MQKKTLEKANEIQGRIDQLDDEVRKLFDFMPPTRDSIKNTNPNLRPNRFGWIMKIGRRKKKDNPREETIMKMGYREFEITYDDIRAMMDLRDKEIKSLKEELEAL